MVTRAKCQSCGVELPGAVMMGLCPNCIGRVVFHLGPEGGMPKVGYGASHRLGDYELLEEIGRGGMGVVYRARQLSLNRLVAVKLILAGQLASDAEVKRFQAEAQAAASLEHPNIIPIFEIGAWEGHHFFSMKLVEGRSLTAPGLEQNIPDLVRLMVQVSRAVHHAHQRGVLHRDLKPGNILVDASGQPHIADFGLARRLMADSELTVSGAVMGSPDYMSPEQAAGQGKRLTTASDIYSLGAILYRLLTGRAPFTGASALQTLQRLADAEPERPSKVRPGIDRDLETICLKCLEKAPERRYSSAEALAEDLERWLRGEPIHARPTSVRERTVKWARRRPALAALAGACVALALAAVTAVTWSWRRGEAALQTAHRQQTRAEAAEQAVAGQLREAYLAQAHANRLTSHPGRRFDSLATIAKAGAIAPSAELRDEAISCLALTDARVVQPVPLPGHLTAMSQPDDAWRRYSAGLPGGEVSVRDFPGGRERMRLPSPGMGLYHDRMVLSHSGRWLGARYQDGRARIWDLKTEKVVVQAGMREFGQALDFSPDDTRVAVADGQSAVNVFDLASGREVTSLAMAPLTPECVAYSPNGHWLAVSDSKDLVVIFEVSSGSVVTNLVHPLAVTSLAWNPDNRRLATASYDRQVRLWDATRGELLHVLVGHGEEVHTVTFHPAGDLLLSSGFNGVFFWNATTGERLFMLPGTRHNVKLSRAGGQFYGLTWDGDDFSFEVCELAHGSPVRTMGSKKPSFGVNTAAFNPDGSLLVQGDGRHARWLETLTGKEIAQVTLPEFNRLQFDSHGQLWGGGSTGLYRCGLRPGETVGEWELSPPQSIIDEGCSCGPAFSPGGDWAAFCHARHQHLVQPESSRVSLQTPEGSAAGYSCLGPAGKLLATGNRRSTEVVVWAQAENQFRERVRLNQAGAFCGIGSFSGDGSRLAVHWGTQVALYETDQWRRLWDWPLKDGLSVLAYAPNGKLLAVRSDRRLIRLLAPESGELLATFETPNGLPVKELTFSPDGTRLAATCDGTGELILWDLRELRRELARLGLDWNQITLPAERVHGPAVSALKILARGSEKWTRPEASAMHLP